MGGKQTWEKGEKKNLEMKRLVLLIWRQTFWVGLKKKFLFMYDLGHSWMKC